MKSLKIKKQNMKMISLILCLILILNYGQCTILNCAYELNNNCLICYFGFKL